MPSPFPFARAEGAQNKKGAPTRPPPATRATTAHSTRRSAESTLPTASADRRSAHPVLFLGSPRRSGVCVAGHTSSDRAMSDCLRLYLSDRDTRLPSREAGRARNPLLCGCISSGNQRSIHLRAWISTAHICRESRQAVTCMVSSEAAHGGLGSGHAVVGALQDAQPRAAPVQWTISEVSGCALPIRDSEARGARRRPDAAAGR